MRRHRRSLLTAAACLTLGVAGAPSAAAQERPPAMPGRDVAVTYRMAAGGMPEMRIAWLTAEQRMRLDMPGQGYMIVDQRGQRAFMVMDEARMVMEIPFAQNTQRMAQLPQGARLTREGQDRVADTACTVWSYLENGRTGRTCITEDGVVLRVVGAGGPEETMEAIAVSYGAQDAARFRPPSGYGAMAMPSLAGGPPPGALPPGGMPPGAMPPTGMPGGMPFSAMPMGAAPPANPGGSPGAKPPNALPQRTR